MTSAVMISHFSVVEKVAASAFLLRSVCLLGIAWGVTFSVWGSFNAPSYVGPEAMWAPLAFAAAVVSFVFYGIRMSAEKGGHLSLCDLAAVVLTFASATVVLVLWYQGGGALFIQYIGENHSIHLTSANAKDFASLILQDHAPSPDAEAHPFYYLHHPNLPTRLINIFQQNLGIEMEGQILIWSLLCCGSLLVGYYSLKPIFGGWAALAGLLFLASTYGAFISNTGDFLRGFHYLLFWATVLVFIKGLAPRLNAGSDSLSPAALLAVGILSVVAVMSDWANFVAYSFLFLGAVFIANPPVGRLIHVASVWTGSAVAAFAAYQLFIIDTVGWETYALDIRATFGVKMGLGSDSLSMEELAVRLREANIVYWPGADQKLTLADMLVVYYRTLRVDLMNWMAVPYSLFVLGCFLIISVRTTLNIFLALGFAAIFIGCLWGGLPMIALLVGLSALLLMLRNFVAAELSSSAREVGLRQPFELCNRVVVWVLLIHASFLAIAAVFPHYFNFLASTAKPPIPFAEMGIFMLAGGASAYGAVVVAPRLYKRIAVFQSATMAFVTAVMEPGVKSQKVVRSSENVGSEIHTQPGRQPAWMLALAHTPGRYGRRLAGWLRLFRYQLMRRIIGVRDFWPTLRSRFLVRQEQTASNSETSQFPPLRVAQYPLLRPVIPKLLFLLLVTGPLLASVHHYYSSPPQYPPYADILRGDEFSGASFVTSNYEGVAWYFTRGWTMMAESNPPLELSTALRFRHFADWRNDEKYQNPDYYLCDRTGIFGWQKVVLDSCGVSEPCDCTDAAAAMEAIGHQSVIVSPTYSIVRMSPRPSPE